MTDRIPSQLELISAAQQGDRMARDAIVDLCRVPIEAAVRRVLGPARFSTEGVDVVHAAFISLLEALPEYRGDASLFTFARRIAEHKAKQLLEKVTRTPLLSADPQDPESGVALIQPGPDPAALVEDREILHHLDERLRARLAPKLRICYQLYFRDGLEAPEVARAMGAQLNNVHQMLYAVRQLALNIHAELTRDGPAAGKIAPALPKEGREDRTG